MDKNLHYLKVLIELNLYPKLKILSEGTEIEDINQTRREIIENFWSELPEEYKVENYKQITLDKLAEMLEDSKKKEKGQDTFTDTLNSVPRAFPALMRAAKVQKRAAKAGFDWADCAGAMDKLEEEMAELEAARTDGSAEETLEEMGDLLFSMVNVSRFLHCDPEEALTKATDKFIRRFAKVERLAAEKGLDMRSASMTELDKLWEQAKQC